MESEIQMLEAELADLRPAALDADLAARLERALEGRSTELTIGQRQVERRLAGLRPAPPRRPEPLLAVLVRIPFPGASKVVRFPGAGRGLAGPRTRKRPWSAAAAVALAGGLAALLVAPGDEDGVTAAAAPARAVVPAADASALSPASFHSGVRDARDLGRMWSGRDQVMRVVEVVYADRVVWLNEDGEEVVMEVPRVEYLMVPENID